MSASQPKRLCSWLFPTLLVLCPGLASAAPEENPQLKRAEKAEAAAAQRFERQETQSKLRALGDKSLKARQKNLAELPQFSPAKGNRFSMEIDRDEDRVSIALKGWFCGGQERRETEAFISGATSLVSALNDLATQPAFDAASVELEFRQLQASFSGRGLFTGTVLSNDSLSAAEQTLNGSSSSKLLQEVSFKVRPTEGGRHIVRDCWTEQDIQLATRIKRGAISFLKRALISYKQRLRSNTQAPAKPGATS